MDATELRLFHRFDHCDGAPALAEAGQRTVRSTLGLHRHNHELWVL